MKYVLLGLVILPSTITTTGHIKALCTPAINSCCTSWYVDYDDITRDRPDAKYLRLVYVRLRTKYISCRWQHCSIRNCPEEQYHQQDDLNFFILHKTQLTSHCSVPYCHLFIEWWFIPLTESVNMTLSQNIATSSNKHVPFSLSRIILAGLLLGMVLSVCNFVSIIWLTFLHYSFLLILVHGHSRVIFI